MKSGTWILAVGALALGIALGALLIPRLGGGAGAEETSGAKAPAQPERAALEDRAPPPAAVRSPEPEPKPARADVAAPPAPAPLAAPAVAVQPSSIQPQPQPPTLPEIRSPGEEPDEQRWRERTASVRDRLVAAYEACLAHAQTSYEYVIGDGHVTQIIDASAFAEAKADLLTARSSLRFLQEEARRAGAPPGWVSVDWSGYPREPSPETGACERVLPEELSQR
jgi:hypothetical protein